MSNDDLLIAVLRHLKEATALLRVVIDERAPLTARIDTAFLASDPRELDFGKFYTARMRQLFDKGGPGDGPIETVRDLIELSEAQVLRHPFIGHECLKRLKEALSARGLYFGMTL
jgi:hypothetical protein